MKLTWPASYETEGSKKCKERVIMYVTICFRIKCFLFILSKFSEQDRQHHREKLHKEQKIDHGDNMQENANDKQF